MPGLVQYPSVGCIVEYFDASATQIGVVTEESGGKLRLLLPNRRETKIPSSRVLPWAGPVIPNFQSLSRDAIIRTLEAARSHRDAMAADIPVMELWEMAQGEVRAAPATWFAELMDSDPDADTVAAYAHALIAAKTRFHFAPPEFEVYSEEMAARRETELARQRERERIISEGCPFMRTLWNAVSRRCAVPAEGQPGAPSQEIAALLSRILFARMADPETQEDDVLWRMLIKGLPEEPYIPVQLLEAWGKVPPHYNFWYDRAGYEPGDSWHTAFAGDIDELCKKAASIELPENSLPFISIDGESTRDVDDAFFLESLPDGGMKLTLALACPAAAWPFGSDFDKAVLHRGTSIYLPEGDSHMMPESLSTGHLSLCAGESRPAFIVEQKLTGDGDVDGPCVLSVQRVTLAANLRYADCQAVLEGRASEESPSLPYESMLRLADEFAKLRLEARIRSGAVVMVRPDLHIRLEGEGDDTRAILEAPQPVQRAMDLVAEMMILANGAVADWAFEHEVPLIYRTQDVALPKEYAGVWTDPLDIAQIMHAMVPSVMDTQPRPHAALGLARYAPVTSPLRRYTDLVNEVQVISALAGTPHFSKEELDQLVLVLGIALDGAGQVQRFRPRYWKLLYFKQQGDRVWWRGVVTEESDTFVNVTLPEQDMFLKGKRNLFDDRTCPGMPVAVRLGKVNPLYNDIHILEAVPADTLSEEDFA